MTTFVVLPNDIDTAPIVVGQPEVFAIMNGDGAGGASGVDAKIAIGFSLSGPYGSLQAILPAPIILPGAGVFTTASSHARAFKPCTGGHVWSVTKNGTFASEASATSFEIAAALFATITFPAGAGVATITFASGGAFFDGDILRLWESLTPDLTQANTAITLSGD